LQVIRQVFNKFGIDNKVIFPYHLDPDYTEF